MAVLEVHSKGVMVSLYCYLTHFILCFPLLPHSNPSPHAFTTSLLILPRLPLSQVLLPKCRDDIAFHKRLNFHLYLALRKATYKPAAFYKGILLPLVASGE